MQKTEVKLKIICNVFFTMPLKEGYSFQQVMSGSNNFPASFLCSKEFKMYKAREKEKHIYFSIARLN